MAVRFTCNEELVGSTPISGSTGGRTDAIVGPGGTSWNGPLHALLVITEARILGTDEERSSILPGGSNSRQKYWVQPSLVKKTCRVRLPVLAQQ